MLGLAAYPILGPSVHPSRVILINYILSQNRNIASFFVRTGNFMDIETIEQELNERFAAPLPEYYNRRIIVWCDDDGEFSDQIDEMSIPDVKIVRLNGTNSFKVKKLIAVDEPSENILLYKPYQDERIGDDWLLDVELYAEEFRADLIAIWMDDMHIPSTIAMRDQMKRYDKFLKAFSLVFYQSAEDAVFKALGVE